MKNLNLFDKFIFFLNSLFAGCLLFSYVLPFIPPRTFALLSVLSLGVPFLILVNIAFLVYWLVRFKSQFLLSLIVLLLGFNHLTSVYEIPSFEDEEPVKDDLKILSYNVRQFNQYGFDKQKNVPEKITAYLKEEDPDIIGMQEYFRGELAVAERFPHNYIKLKTESAEFGLAIFSKFPIINSGSLDFITASNNDGVFADVVTPVDTIRVINVHLQSYSVKPDLSKLEKEKSKRVFLGMGQTFAKQQDQMEEVFQLLDDSPYRVIIVGDFNNTAYSYIYREIVKRGYKDAFKEGGSGFGRSYDFDFFPLRIDFIFVDETIEVNSFETEEVHYSDHFPIQARISL